MYMFYVIRLWILHHALPESVLYWKVCYIYLLFMSDSSTTPGLYLHLCWYVFASYNGIYIDMFVYVIQYNCWLCFILGISPYISAWVIIPIYRCYIHNCINMFVNVISMFNRIFGCNWYNMPLGCTIYWVACHAYLLYMICYAIVAILVDLSSQKWINISLF